MGEAEAVEAKGGSAAEEEGGAGEDGGGLPVGRDDGGLRGGQVGALARSRFVVSHTFREEREKGGKPAMS